MVIYVTHKSNHRYEESIEITQLYWSNVRCVILPSISGSTSPCDLVMCNSIDNCITKTIIMICSTSSNKTYIQINACLDYRPGLFKALQKINTVPQIEAWGFYWISELGLVTCCSTLISTKPFLNSYFFIDTFHRWHHP